MSVRSLAVLAVVLAGCDAASPSLGVCRGEEILEKATAAYLAAASLTDTARYEVRVPGAPPKQELVEFGFGEDAEAYLRMPGLYVMHAGKLQLVTRVDGAGPDEPYLETKRAGNLQATADAAFEGHGPPLVPAPLLLREAASVEDRIQAFRSKLLAPLRLDGCESVIAGGLRFHDVSLAAENGRVRARFDAAAGWLLEMHLEIVPAPGAESIRAEARFAPLAGGVPPPLRQMPPSNRRVERLAQLGSGADASRVASFADVTLTDLDGVPVKLSDLEGQVVIVEFWARWCAPCRVTLPTIEKFSRRVRERELPVRVLLVNTQEDFESAEEARTEIRRYLAWAKIGLPSLRDPGSAMHGRSGGGLPLTLVIGPSGELVETHAGFKPDLEARLERRIHTLLAGR